MYTLDTSNIIQHTQILQRTYAYSLIKKQKTTAPKMPRGKPGNTLNTDPQFILYQKFTKLKK